MFNMTPRTERGGRSPRGVLAALVCLAALVEPLSGQMVWTESVASGPSSRQPSALAYDAQRGTMLSFGGWSGGLLGDTWLWNGAGWKRLAMEGPSPRRTDAIAYDSARGVFVLFGGFVCGEDCAEFVGDTWEFDGSTWREVDTQGPSPRRTSMSYDSGRGVMVLHAGVSASDDTWEWDGESWTQVSSGAGGPGARTDHPLAFDERRGVTVLFGGYTTASGPVNDTWEWDGTNWSRVSTTGPSPRWGAEMVYDSRRGVMVLHGGNDETQDFDETWEWDGTEWTLVATGGPPARKLHAMAYDRARGHVVVFGGRALEGQVNLSDTWTFRSGIASAHSDYTGDGATDLALYDPTTRRWHVEGQRKRFRFGTPVSLPVPGDYDGDGKTEAAYFDPSSGTWRVRKGYSVLGFGAAGDLPAPGDYDGDDITDPALFRPDTGQWFVIAGSSIPRKGQVDASEVDISETVLGQLGDLPIPSDYNGDGLTDRAVYRPSKRRWLIDGQKSVKFGKRGDIPVPADYDGDGRTDIAVWAPSKAQWKVRSGEKARYGRIGDVPVPADYDADGAADFAVYRMTSRTWMVRNQFDRKHGRIGELPLVGGR